MTELDYGATLAVSPTYDKAVRLAIVNRLDDPTGPPGVVETPAEQAARLRAEIHPNGYPTGYNPRRAQREADARQAGRHDGEFAREMGLTPDPKAGNGPYGQAYHQAYGMVVS